MSSKLIRIYMFFMSIFTANSAFSHQEHYIESAFTYFHTHSSIEYFLAFSVVAAIAYRSLRIKNR